MKRLFAIWLISSLAGFYCSSPVSESAVTDAHAPKSNPFDLSGVPAKTSSRPEVDTLDALPDGWVDLAQIDADIIMDLRYATRDNFVETRLYDCPRCLLRSEVAYAIKAVQDLLEKEGLGLKMFDCYRPRPVQEALWEVLPDARYVTNPARGSMHNRGAAVDLTLVDSLGHELEMGTTFDYFGERAYHTFKDLKPQVLANRRHLIRVMHQAGFRHIRTEWWHYSYTMQEFELSDFVWPCP